MARKRVAEMPSKTAKAFAKIKEIQKELGKKSIGQGLRKLEYAESLPDEPHPIVRLQGQDKPVFVKEVEHPKLGEKQYELMDEIIKAGPLGLKKSQLEDIFPSARRMLYQIKDLSKYWKEAIEFPGYGKTGYNIKHI